MSIEKLEQEITARLWELSRELRKHESAKIRTPSSLWDDRIAEIKGEMKALKLVWG